jgi:hypothetical protein
MSPQQAARTAAHARRLLTAKILTPHSFAVLDALLWRLRPLGQWAFTAPYKTIARLAGVSRDTAIETIKTLVHLGVIAKQRQRVLVHWGRNRAQTASRQIENRYVFAPPSTESASPAADRALDKTSTVLTDKPVDKSPLAAALARLGQVMGLL